jgi:hypothetical protein
MPAMPFVVALITASDIGDRASQFQVMTALSLNFAAILIDWYNRPWGKADQGSTQCI